MRKGLPGLRLYGFLRQPNIHINIQQKRSANLAVSRAFYCVSIKPQLI